MRNREYLQGMRDTNEILGNILSVVGCIIGAGILVALVTIIVKCLVWLMFSWKV